MLCLFNYLKRVCCSLLPSSAQTGLPNHSELALIPISPATHPTHPGKYKIAKLGGWFLVCDLTLTKLEDIMREQNWNYFEVFFQSQICRSFPELNTLGI